MRLRCKFSLALSLLTIALTSGQAVHAQQLYKWVGPDGKVVFSDQPPPTNVKKVESQSLNSGSPSDGLPFDVAAAVRKSPVTLYTGDNCAPCAEGVSFLKSSGIPFSEKTVKTNEDINKLTQVSGETQLPFLLIGSKKFKGLDKDSWRTALSSAGYPDSNKLPAGYHFAPPAPAAPPTKVKDATAADKSATPAPTPAPAANPASDPGFRF